MLYQIMQGKKYSKIAIKLLAEIDILAAIYPKCDFLTYIQVPHLALSIAVHPSYKTVIKHHQDPCHRFNTKIQ